MSKDYSNIEDLKKIYKKEEFLLMSFPEMDMIIDFYTDEDGDTFEWLLDDHNYVCYCFERLEKHDFEKTIEEIHKIPTKEFYIKICQYYGFLDGAFK